MKALFLGFISFAFTLSANARTWHINAKDSYLELEVDTNLVTTLTSGETPQLNGHFCLRKENPKHCKLLTPEDLSKYDVRFFYPDITQEVTDSVSLVIKEDRHEFSFTTSPIVETQKPVFIAQIINKGSKVLHYQKLLAKFQALSGKLLQKKTHWPKAGGEHVREFTNTLKKIEARIALKLQGESALIAKREFPLQVGNNISKASTWSNAAEEWQIESSVSLGTSFEGEKSWIHVALTPYVTNTYDFMIEYKIDGITVKNSDVSNPTSIVNEKFLTSQLSTGTHEFEILVKKNEKKNSVSEPRWNLTFAKKYYFQTLSDDVAPTFSDLNPVAGRYVSRNQHSLSYVAQDLRGRINQDSIKAIFELQSGEQLDLSGDLSYQTNGEVLVPEIHGGQEGSSGYRVSGTFTNLPEGIHHLSLRPEDFAGNMAKGAEWELIYDRSPPFILLPFTAPYMTNNRSFELPITVTDLTKTRVKVSVNGVLQLEVEAADGTFTDILAIELEEGPNFVTLQAIDEAGNESVINYPVIILDSTPPELASLNLSSGDLITTKKFTLTGAANEVLLAVMVNGEEIDVPDGSPNFAHVLEHFIDGPQRVELTLIDLAGNQSQFGIDYEFLLKLLDPQLVAVQSSTEEGKLKIVGYPGATQAGLEITAKDGFFNSGEAVSAEDGSFEITLDLFRYAKVTAFDPSRDRGESTIVSFVADTTLAGTVKDIYDNPLPRVTITILSSGQSTQTDTNGNFAIANPALGDQVITIDGRTIPIEVTNNEREFSVTTMNVSLGNLQKNIIERPIYLAPKLLDGSETVVTAGAAVMVSSQHAPGVEINIPAGVTRFPNGSASGSINIMEIPAEKTTVELLEMATPETVYALEPSGLKFSQRVDLVLPNVNEFPDGTELIILSKNSETGNWEVDGSATVEEDQVKTKPGEGISHFSEVYASPLGMEIKAFRDGDKPTFDTLSGAVSSSVSLPSFKSMGQDVSAGLLYNSQWANPNIVISNIFDLPRKYIEMSLSTSQGGALGSAKAKISIQQWIVPEYIDAQFTSNNVTSEKIRFTGMPDKSLVSYKMDLGELASGIHPAKSSYEIGFKAITLTTLKTKSKSWGRTKTKTKSWRDEKLLEEIFPQELVTTIYHQNKKNSEYGSGWRLNLGKKILNPEQDRLMLEHENGQVAAYTLKNTVETVQYDVKGIRSFTTDGTDVVGVNMEGNVLRSSGGTTNVERVLPPYQGQMGVNTSWYSNTTRKCTKSGYRGCRRYQYTYYYSCNKFNADFNHQRQVKSMLMEGGSLVYLDQTGAIFGNSDQFSLSGEMVLPDSYKVATNSSGEQDYQPYCRSSTGGDCSTVRENVNSYTIRVTNGSTNTLGWCNNPGLCNSGNCTTQWKESDGFIPQKGFYDGLSTRAKFNAPVAFVKGPRPDSYLVADYGNNLIRMIDMVSGNTSTVAGNQKTFDDGNGGAALAASIYHPKGLAVLADGSYLVSSEGGYIRRVSTDGLINAYIGKPTSKGGILSDVTDMREVALSSPSGMVLDSENDFLYVADTGHNRILRINLATEEARVVAGNGTCTTDDTFNGKAALDTSLCRPEQIALDSNKNLLVLDEPNKRVRRINFRSPENGITRYQALAKDNTELLKNQDGSFLLKTRSGTETLFSAQGLELQTIDRAGRSTAYQYDPSQRLTSVILPTGQQIQMNYSGDKLTTIIDAAGRATSFQYSGDNLIAVGLPDGTEKNFEYNANGVLTEERNQRGIATRYILNNWERLSQVMRPDGTSISMDDAVSKTISNNNVNGNFTELRSIESDQNELRDTIADAKGNTTTFSRDTSGYVQEIKDAQGLVTRVERDGEGRPTKIIKPDLTYTEMTYDSLTGDLLTRFESDSNLSECYSYNTFGQLISYKDPLNRAKINTYDPVTGFLIKETDPNGNFVQNSYNSLGLILASSNTLGLQTSYVYDSHGNVSEIRAPMGEKSTFVRDGAGNVISKTNAKNQTTQFSFDEVNRLRSVITPGNFTTSYAYLPTGELSLITNPEGHETNFEYDHLGRLKKRISPRGQVTQLFHDQNDNVIREITPKGDAKVFSYNEKNQLLQKVLPDETYNFLYNDQGELIETSNLKSRFEMTYVKILGQNYLKTVVSNVQGLPTQTTTYGFNAAGKRTSMNSDYLSVTYGYDAAYRMTGLANNLGQNFSFGYDEANRLIEINRSGSTSTLGYDNNSFLTNFTHKKSNEVIENFIYTRDQIGNRTSIQTSKGTFAFGYDNENQLVSATHPEADELHALETFSYDPLGNRTSDNQGTYAYDDKKFRLEEDYKFLYAYDLNGNLVSKQEKGMSGKVWNYSYSSENQLMEASFYEGRTRIRTVGFTYDALGRRVKKSVDDAQAGTSYERRYAYDSSEIIAELDESNIVLATYTHSGLRTDDVLAVEISQEGASRGLASAPGKYLYLKDGLGSVQAITTESGQLVQRYIYSSFGKLLKTVDAVGLESTAFKTGYSYTNREFDEETGLYYYRARYYDSGTGRFMAQDPHPGSLGSPGSFNSQYAYVGNSAPNFTDPSGAFRIKIDGSLFVRSLSFALGGPLLFSIYSNLNSRDRGTVDAVVISTSILVAAGFTGGAAAGAFASGPISGALIGGLAGGLVGGTGFAATGVGTFGQGFIAGAIAGGIAGYNSGLASEPQALDRRMAFNKVGVCAFAVGAGLLYLFWKYGAPKMKLDIIDDPQATPENGNSNSQTSPSQQNTPQPQGEENACYA